MGTATDFLLRTDQAGQVLVLRGRLDARVTADVRLALAASVAEGTGELVLDVPPALARLLFRTRLDRVLRTTRTPVRA
jgi:hypothetical protein